MSRYAFTNWCSPLPPQPSPDLCQLPTSNLFGDILYSFSHWPSGSSLCYCKKEEDCPTSMNHLNLIFSESTLFKTSSSNTQLSWFTPCFFLLLTYRRHHLTTSTVFITVIYYLVLSSTFLYHILKFWQNFWLLFWVIIYPKQLPNLGRKIMPSASCTIIITNLKGTKENLKDGIFKYHLHLLRKSLPSKQG